MDIQVRKALDLLKERSIALVNKSSITEEAKERMYQAGEDAVITIERALDSTTLSQKQVLEKLDDMEDRICTSAFWEGSYDSNDLQKDIAFLRSFARALNNSALEIVKRKREDIAIELNKYKASKWEKMDFYKVATEERLQKEIDLLDKIITEVEGME